MQSNKDDVADIKAQMAMCHAAVMTSMTLLLWSTAEDDYRPLLKLARDLTLRNLDLATELGQTTRDRASSLTDEMMGEIGHLLNELTRPN